MATDVELLQSYACARSESAFTELVQRHIDLVFSAALREAHGDASLAEDITQTVFVELAKKASKLIKHPALAGWLYTCVRRMAANLRRSEDRRQGREQEAKIMNELLCSDPSDSVWRQVQPVLDDAMPELKTGIISAVVAASVATPLVMQHHAQVKLREENQSLRQQVEGLTAENDRLSNLLTQASRSGSLPKEQLSELMKLRGEIGLL